MALCKQDKCDSCVSTWHHNKLNSAFRFLISDYTALFRIYVDGTCLNPVSPVLCTGGWSGYLLGGFGRQTDGFHGPLSLLNTVAICWCRYILKQISFSFFFFFFSISLFHAVFLLCISLPTTRKESVAVWFSWYFLIIYIDWGHGRTQQCSKKNNCEENFMR